MTKARAQEFLAKLGIGPIEADDYSPRYEEELQRHGYSWESLRDVTDTMGPEAMNLPFVSEVTAAETLGRNYERIVESMVRLANIHRQPNETAPRLIAELGGGTGLLSLWLAFLKPDTRYDVFDHAINPLHIGQLWAKRLELSQVHFHHSSYAQIAATSELPKYDWVICEHSVDLNSYADIWEGDQTTSNLHTYFNQKYIQLATAIKHLLAPTGVASFHSGPVPPWSLGLLCQALRDHALRLDWQRSSNSDGLSLVLTHGDPLRFAAVRDEMFALLTQATEEMSLHPAYGRALEHVFGPTADCPLDIRTRDDDRTERRYRIVESGGLALLLRRDSVGDESTILTSAANIADLARRCHDEIAGSTVIDQKISDALRSLL